MADDIILAKSAIIERRVARVREVHAGVDDVFARDLTRQDAIVLNLQRACEASIDLAMHIVRVRRLGVPQESREAFDLLERAGMIDSDLAVRMKRMVGFRNVAVHDYRKLDLEIVRSIIGARLPDFLDFTRIALALM